MDKKTVEKFNRIMSNLKVMRKYNAESVSFGDFLNITGHIVAWQIGDGLKMFRTLFQLLKKNLKRKEKK